MPGEAYKQHSTVNQWHSRECRAGRDETLKVSSGVKCGSWDLKGIIRISSLKRLQYRTFYSLVNRHKYVDT